MNIIEAWQSGWNQILGSTGDFFSGLFGGAIDLLNGFFNGLGTYLGEWLTGLGLSITIPDGVLTVLDDLTKSIGYIIPVQALLPIPIFMLSFYIAKLIFALYQIIASTIIRKIHISV